jgi:hypothetical protein
MALDSTPLQPWAEQVAEIIAFADYWKQATGAEPGLLVFDSQLTTYKDPRPAHRPRHQLAHAVGV